MILPIVKILSAIVAVVVGIGLLQRARSFEWGLLPIAGSQLLVVGFHLRIAHEPYNE